MLVTFISMLHHCMSWICDCILKLDSTHGVQTSTRLPSWICLSDISCQNYCHIQWRCLKPRLRYYKWNILSMMVLTLNFDLDLWKVHMHQCQISWKSEITITVENERPNSTLAVLHRPNIQGWPDTRTHQSSSPAQPFNEIHTHHNWQVVLL